MLVSALIAGGPPASVLEAVGHGRAALVLAEVVMGELEQVLTRKLGFTETSWRAAERSLEDLASERVGVPSDVPVVTGHRADDEILATAVAAGVDVLVTGDRRHLLPVGRSGGVRILAPQTLLAELP